jgi:uncharacterized protein (TIGR03435 family)
MIAFRSETALQIIKRSLSKTLVLAAIGIAAVGVPMVLLAAPTKVQSTAGQAPTTKSPTVPQWQIDAGGKMAFDVVSVKQDTAPPSRTTVHTNVPLEPQDGFTPTGGLLSSANYPLIFYISFAYKLTPNEAAAVQAQLPKWASANRYDIEARADGKNPTKDQYRLMMQALLGNRFKLAVHYEKRQLPVFGLVLDKPGKLGPQFQQHPPDAACSNAAPPPGPPATIAAGFPEICGGVQAGRSSTPGRARVGGRNVSMDLIVNEFSLQQLSGIDRPILDKTGLSGTFDFVMEFTPEIHGPLAPGVTFQPDPTGPTFLEALKEQLGLKLDSQTGPVDVFVVDHVEEPSAN